MIQIVNKQINNSRVLFWGMENLFSRYVLEGLLKNEIHPAAIILPDFQGESSDLPINKVKPESPELLLPLMNPYLQNNMQKITLDHQIPLYRVHDLSAQYTIQLIKEIDPSLAIVACFPKRFPKEILKLPDAGFLNLHPSMLPKLRGPYPLFWTFRLDVQPGVTVHFMDEGLDTGAIVLQEPIELPTGIGLVEAESLMAKLGADLLAKASLMFESGNLVGTPQQGAGSTYPRPKSDDFSISTSWSAKRAFNFIRGTADWNHPYLIQGSNLNIQVRSAVSYSPATTQKAAIEKDGADILIQFKNGILRARQ